MKSMSAITNFASSMILSSFSNKVPLSELVEGEVRSDHHSVGKLPPCQRCVGILTLQAAVELNKDLCVCVCERERESERENLIGYIYLFLVQYCTLPTPGTDIPSIGRGISTVLTWPYLLHSSRTSSMIPAIWM